MEMPAKLRRYALCVDVDEGNGTCLMIYEYDLNAVEVRAEFSGAQTGKWYRFDLGKGARRSWEAVDERLPTRVKCKDIQISLPIFFIPNLKCFGCTWRVAPPASLCDKMSFKFFSPRLESAGKVNVSAERLDAKGIRPGEQCNAFLTLNFRGPGTAVKPPQWTLDSIEDFQSVNFDPLHNVLCPRRLDLPPTANLTTPSVMPKEWGVLLRIDIDPEDERTRTGAILCLRDGKLAFGRVLRIDGGDCWRAELGDIVGFCSIDVDCFLQPVRMAFNVLAWKSRALRDFNEPSEHFPQEAFPGSLHVQLLMENTSSQLIQYLFELSFTIDEQTLSSWTGTRTFRVDRLGLLLDPEGKLSSAWNNTKCKNVVQLSVRVKANLCLFPEQQHPLWVVVELLEIGEAPKLCNDNKRKHMADERSPALANCLAEVSLPMDNGRLGGEERLSSTEPPEQFSIVQDGGFGMSVASKRYQKCLQQQLNSPEPNGDVTFSVSVTKEAARAVVPIANAMAKLGKTLGTGSNNDTRPMQQPIQQQLVQREEQQQQPLNGIVLFMRNKGDEMLWTFYDEQTRRFTRSTSAKKIKQPSPVPGEWFRIAYQNHKSSASIAITTIRRETDLSHLPIHWAKPQNSNVWEKLLNGKFEEIVWETPTKTAENESRTCDAPQQTPRAKTPQPLECKAQPVQPQKAQMAITPQPIKRNAPVPVTNVFMRQNSTKMSTDTTKPAGIQQQQNGLGKQQPKQQPIVDMKNSLPPLLNCNAKFFLVGTQMAGVIVIAAELDDKYAYKVWPFCTGHSLPRERFLISSQRLPIGHWLKFAIEDFDREFISEENCHGLASWMQTHTAEMHLYIDCGINVPDDFGVNPEAELSTTRHKPSDPKTPFIRKLVATDLIWTRLATHFRGSVCKVRIKYANKLDKVVQQTRGYWLVSQIIAN
uniref:Uncharacterized protein n=1 Tax=Globodera rostochiensis TaxID=31243 RepID=A0A914I031_GLORO